MKVAELEKLTKKAIRDLTKLMLANMELFLEVIEPSWNTKAIPAVHSKVYGIHDKIKKKEITSLYMVVYRGFAKTSIKRNVTLRDICFGLEKFIVFASETQRLARIDLNSVKNEIRFNPQIKFLFGDMTKAFDDEGHRVEKWGADETRFYRQHDPKKFTMVMAVGMTSAFRGFNVDGLRITKNWYDDFESEKNTRTSNMREDLETMIDTKFYPARDAENYTEIYQGTIVHPKSVLAKIKYKVENGIPCSANYERGAYFERAISSDSNDYGIGTWPEYHDRIFWEDAKRKMTEKEGYWKFLQEFYNIPRQQGSPKFKADMVKELKATFHTYKHLKWIERDGKKINVNVYVGVDPAYAFAQKSDSTSMFVTAVTPRGTYVILKIIHEKVGQTKKIERLVSIQKNYQPDLINIEAYGAALELPHVLEEKSDYEDLNMNIEIFNERVGKSKKYMEGMETDINNGKVFYIEGCENIDIFKNEMSLFSGEERYHDDTLDGFFLSREKAERPYEMDISSVLSKMKAQDAKNNNPNAWNPYQRMAEFSAKHNTRK